MFTKKNLIRIIINTALGLVLIFFWLQFIDIQEVFHELSLINPLTVLPFILFFALAGIFRAGRFKILLSEYKIPLKNLIYLTYLAQLLSFTIPLRLGELTKGVYLSTEYGNKGKITFPKAVVWTFLDRFIDFWMVLVYALILLLVIPTNMPTNLKPILLVLILFFTSGALLLVFFPNYLKRIVSFLVPFFIFPQLKAIFLNLSNFLIDSGQFLNKGFKKTTMILVLTFLATTMEALGWLILFDVVFKSNLDFFRIQLGSLLSALTYLIPSAPGYVGSAEAGTLAVFSLGLGYNPTLTSVVAVLFHLLTLICILLFGLLSLYLLGFDLSLVFQKLKKQKK